MRRTKEAVQIFEDHAAALWGRWKVLLTGSVIAVSSFLLGLFGGLAIPWRWSVTIIVMTILWAEALVWADERRARRVAETERDASEAARIAALARILAEAPQLVVEYDAPGFREGAEELRVRNTSAAVAYNVQIETVTLNGLTIDFPLIPHMAPHEVQTLAVHARGERGSSLNRLHSVLMIGANDLDLDVYGAPLIFGLSVRFSDFGGARFRSETRFEFTRILKTAKVLQIQGERLP